MNQNNDHWALEDQAWRLYGGEGKMSVMAKFNTYLIAWYLALVILGLFVGVACRNPTDAQISNVDEVATRHAQVTVQVESIVAQPLQEMLPQIDADARARLENFMATVPDPLPNDLAYPQFFYMEPTLSNAEYTYILQLLNGFIRLQGVLVNPGSNPEQTNVICLRNTFQVNCSPETDIWAIELPPKSLAFVPYEIQAEPGDVLTFLYIADREPLRLFPASKMRWYFVEHQPSAPAEFVQLAAHEKVEVGCDFSTIAQSDNLKYGMPGTQKRGELLSLVFQTCEPVEEELVQLVPIVDRRQVIELPGEVWRQPLRLSNPATVLPLDTRLLGDAEEFQVALVPVGNSAIDIPDWWGWFPFTQAVHFVD